MPSDTTAAVRGDDLIPADYITDRLDNGEPDADTRIANLLREEREAAAGRYLVEAVKRTEPAGVFAEIRFHPLKGQEELGELSRRFEVGTGGPGTISGGVGDPGGKSYGTWQMTSRPEGGTVRRFLDDPACPFAPALAGHDIASAAFDAAWKALAAKAPEAFRHAQHAFILRTHYAPAAEMLRARGFDAEARSHALRDVLWSTAVQHGARRAEEIFGIALAAAGAGAKDAAVIAAVYAERGRRDAAGGLARFAKSSREVQESVARRFRKEEADALAMLAKELAGAAPGVPSAPGAAVLAVPAGPPAGPATAAPASGEPIWFAVAKGEIGQKEAPAGADNPRITEYFTWTSLGAQPDSVAWCGAFVAFCLGTAGVLRKGSGSARAADWMMFGKALDAPARGCIVVLEPQAAGASGHVGFLDRIEDRVVHLLGGNQAEAVNVAPFPLGEVRKFGFRWPA